MKIAVIAANGRSGQAFVKAALAAGHSIRAGVHHASTLSAQPNLTIMPCDATNKDEVISLITNQDAVVSFIGHVKDSAPDVQTVAMQTIISAMQATGVTRIVSLTGTGVRYPGDHIPLIDRILNACISVLDPARVTDGRNHVKVLEESGMNWTVLRVLKLRNVTPHPFSLQLHGPTKWYVSREEVAQAALHVLEDGSYIGQAPILSKEAKHA